MNSLPALRLAGRTRCAIFLGCLGVAWLTASVGRAVELEDEGSSQSGAVNGRARVVRVGATSDNYPYSFVDEDGHLHGFVVELVDALARVTGLEIRREVANGNRLYAAFRRGELDMLQAYTQTAGREHVGDFSVPYLILQGAVFVKKSDAEIRTLKNLHGRAFAIVGASSIAEEMLRNHGIEVSPVYVSSSEEGLRLVESGRCAGVLVSQLTAAVLIDKHSIKGLRSLPLSAQSEMDVRYCLAVQKGDARLLARLNEGLAVLNRTGEFDLIYRKWFGRYSGSTFTRQQVVAYVAAALALAFVAALWGLSRQRSLLKRIAGQAGELGAKEALLHALYDHIPMVMCVFEAAADGPRILTINQHAARVLGVDSGRAVDRRLTELAADAEWTMQLESLLRKWPAPGSLVREERVFAGTEASWIFTLVPLAPCPREPARLCVLAEDVTRRRQLDEEIARSRKLRAVGELVGGIAHEFNNLLTPVMLKVSEIGARWGRDRALLHEVTVVEQAMGRASELTRRLLTFGRKAEVHQDAASVSEVATACVELLKQTIDRRIIIDTELPATLPPVALNGTDLHQVLLNLLLNARDTLMEKMKSPPLRWTPRIQIEVSMMTSTHWRPAENGQAQSWQRLTVRDNGMGMAPEVKERIFEPFYTTKQVGQGTGLGLATVWHIVTENFGRLEVESAAGTGSAFHVMLPVTERAAPQSPNATTLPPPLAPAPAAPAAPVAPKARRILLAEDEELVARTVVALLKRAGHTVTHVSDGEEAWRRLEPSLNDFDLLVLDLNLPGVDGLELVKRARATQRFTGKIVLVSGRITATGNDEYTALGADACLAKPFSISELLKLVDSP